MKALEKIVNIFKKENPKKPDTYLEELDIQCNRFSFVLSILALIIWIRYINIDKILHPEESLMPILRMGLITVGGINLFIHLFIRNFRYKGIFLLSILSFYYIEASATLAGLAKAEGPYFAGYIASILVVLFTPLPRTINYIVTIISAFTFFVIIKLSKISISSVELNYFVSLCTNVLILSLIFIYLLDKARLSSYKKSKELEVKIKEIERQKEIVEVSRNEIETLNDFTKSLNENPDLDFILNKVFSYIANTFSINFIWLNMISGDKKHIFTYKYSLAIPLSEESERFLKNFKVNLEPSIGTLYNVYERKKTLYLNRQLEKFLVTDVDMSIVQNLNLKSFLNIPLQVNSEVIAVICFTNLNTILQLSKSEVLSIERFCRQIEGAIHTSFLLKQVKIEKENALQAKMEADKERKKSDELLINILPTSVANDLKKTGKVEPLLYDSATVLFTDFVGFTSASEQMLPDELVQELDALFSQFDAVCERNHLEKLKTIGDSYMCAGGLPEINSSHAVDACLAALEFRDFMAKTEEIKKILGLSFWELRIGIHTGPVIAGVIGSKKFAYDIWGDTVNTASRMESSGMPGEVNISGSTYELVKDFFVCHHRGKIAAKNKGEVDMYLVKSIVAELSVDGAGMVPNEKFNIQKKSFVANSIN